MKLDNVISHTTSLMVLFPRTIKTFMIWYSIKQEVKVTANTPSFVSYLDSLVEFYNSVHPSTRIYNKHALTF